MRKSILISSLALAAFMASGAIAQNNQGYAASAPGVVGVARTASVAGSIKAVDQATRAVTLVGDNGAEITVTAGPEVQNFGQLKAGDRVEVQYAEALVVELKKGGGLPVARTEQTGVSGAKPGEKPGAMAGRQVTIVGDVIAIDAATRKVTVKGPERTIDINISDPEQFKLIKTGDQLQATYVEGYAVGVRPAAK